jgi:MoxR-like ATPase
MVEGRDYLTPEDVKALAGPALAHRITLRPELWVRQIEADDVMARLIASVPAPQTLPRAVAP